MIRFLHASDFHLGKSFGGFPEEVRHRLRQARQEAIGALAKAACDGAPATSCWPATPSTPRPPRAQPCGRRLTQWPAKTT